MRLFAEEAGIFPMVVPVDLAGAGNDAVTRVNMTKYAHAEIVIFKAAGAAAEPVVVTLSQHTVGTGGTPKALAIPRGVYVKNATAIADTTVFVKEARDDAPNTNRYTGTSSVEKQAFITIPVRAEDLDTNNGYVWLSAAIGDVGNGAQIGACFVLCFDPQYSPAPDAIYHA